VASIVSVLAHPATLSAATRLPSVSSRAHALSAIASSLIALVIFSTAVVAASATFLYLGLDGPAEIALLTALMLLPQGIYVIAFAESIRRLEYSTMASLRLTYGVIVALATLAACIFQPTGFGLVGAYAVASLLSAAITAIRMSRARFVRAIWQEASLSRSLQLARANWRFSLALTFGNISSQAPGLVVAQLGTLSAPWAVMTRVGSGFQTLGGAVVGPAIDIATSAAVHRGDRSGLRGTLARGSVIGALLSVGALIAIGISLLWVGEPISNRDTVILIVSSLLFWAPQVYLSTVGRMLAIIGAGRLQLGLDTGRVIITIASLLLLRGETLLLAVSALSIVAMGCYLLFLAFAIRRTQPRREAEST